MVIRGLVAEKNTWSWYVDLIFKVNKIGFLQDLKDIVAVEADRTGNMLGNLEIDATFSDFIGNIDLKVNIVGKRTKKR